MNNSSKADLKEIYNKAVHQKDLSATDIRRVGLLNICRTSNHPIELKISEDEKGVYAMLGVHLTKDSNLAD